VPALIKYFKKNYVDDKTLAVPNEEAPTFQRNVMNIL
jgi:hypothetical protein